MSMQSQYVDKEGLERVVQNIKNIYARKDILNEKEQSLYDYIDEKNQRAIDSEGSLDDKIDAEELRATQAEGALDEKIDAEESRAVLAEGTLNDKIDAEESRATRVEQELSNVDTALEGRISNLEIGKVSNVIVNGVPVVTDTVANIRFDSIIAGMSVITYDHFIDFPELGEDNKLYIDLETRILYQWTGSSYKEAGKFNVLNVDDLPEDGDSNVLYIKDGIIYMWIWDGDIEHDKWKEISGQDVELRAEFEAYKTHHHTLSDIDDATDLHLDWENIDNKPETYAPSSHTHTSSDITDLHLDWESIDDKPDFDEIYYQKEEVYNKEEVDDIVEHIIIPEAAIEAHIDNPAPHPAFESRIETLIENSIEEAVEGKADASTLTTHILNRENPHKVTKAQIELGNVDNTSDANKPISNATQAALDLKVNTNDIADDLETIVSSKVLSAKQGARLKGLIQDTQSEIQSIGNPLHFKGTVSSIEELGELTGMIQGDCWQIVEPEPEEGEEKTEHDGEMYSWTGSEWKQIIASVSDISAYAASLEDIYEIIDNYSAE